MTAISLQNLTPGQSLESYMRAIATRPVLSADEELDLARKFRQYGDLEAARQLVISHLRFVVHMAKGYAGYGLPLSDLIQEGNVGLMKAVRRFDPEVGVRLISFAVHWIKSEIHEFILRNWRIVKIATTKAQRKLFYNLRSAKKRLGWFNRQEIEEVAADLGVPADTVVEMEKRMAATDASFEGHANDADDYDALAPAQYLADEDSDPALVVMEADTEARNAPALQAAIAELDGRSADIVKQRWLSEEKSTLRELADQYGISIERIRQLEQNAFKKMRGLLAA